jgi:hypothetical protein
MAPSDRNRWHQSQMRRPRTGSAGCRQLVADGGRETGAAKGSTGRLVALVPTFARQAWLADPARPPLLPVRRNAPAWFQLAA